MVVDVVLIVVTVVYFIGVVVVCIFAAVVSFCGLWGLFSVRR